jgi:hypothetical protein
MATVSVTLVKPQFTATLVAPPTVSVSVDGSTVNVFNTNTTVSVSNPNTVIDVITDGIMTVLGASTATVVKYTGNAVTTIYSLTDELLSNQALTVSVSGLEQEFNDAYTTYTRNTGTTTATSYVQFTEAPPSGSDIVLTFYSVRVAYDIKGDTGPQGPVGPQGPEGPPGPTGNASWDSLLGKNSTTGPEIITLGKYTTGAGWDGQVSIGRGAAAGNKDGNVNLHAVMTDSVSIGTWAGSGHSEPPYNTMFRENSVAIGNLAGINQSSNAIAIGYGAGTGQNDYSVAIGVDAGNGGIETVAIGLNAQKTVSANYNVAIGRYAGSTNQGSRATAIGSRAGETSQGNFSVAIGGAAGQTNLPDNTIVINAQGELPSGSIALNPETNGFFVNPVRQTATNSNMLTWNSVTSEIARGFPRMPAYASNTAYVAANPTPIVGHFFWDTTLNKMKVYSGSAWISLN